MDPAHTLNGSLLFAREVAAYLRIHEHTVRNLALRGTLTGTKVGKYWRFKPEWVEEFISKQTRKSPV